MQNRNRKSHFQKNHNLIYQPQAISATEKQQILSYLQTIHPLWEMRFSNSNPPPSNEDNRSLLRPVYWLGNWQFACLDYYHPPKGIQNRCVEAENYPPVLEKIVHRIEQTVHENMSEKDIPHGWHLNTCLINYYGDKLYPAENGELKKLDVARVGEHKDFEPGPVGSISFGEKALFQFVKSEGKEHRSQVILQQWLEDSSLQIFGGDKFKKRLFHRVQRVENKGIRFENLNTSHFETRRINFTFRYVPRDHIKIWNQLPENLREDTKAYIQRLGQFSTFWKNQSS